MLRLAFILVVWPLAALAQDGIFADRAALDTFVNNNLMTRNFVPVIQQLGGRDEYTTEQLNGINTQFLNIYRADFGHVSTVRERRLGDGFHEEIRAYWTDDAGYLWLYLLTHQRASDVVVLSFKMNSSAAAVFERFK